MQRLAEQQRVAAPPEGIAPHLVFRIPLAVGAYQDELLQRLEQAGMIVVSVESDRAVVACRDTVDLESFMVAVEQYKRGPTQGRNSTKWDVFEYIEVDQMRTWTPEDRMGPRLRAQIGLRGDRVDPNAQYVVEIELWYPGSRELASTYVDEIRSFTVRDERSRVLDQFIGVGTCLVKVRISGHQLRQVLALPAVAEVELPPVPMLDPNQAYRATLEDLAPLPPPEENGPKVCVIDSGVASGNPLLRPYVLHEEAVLTNITDPSDRHGHGTMVAGIAVFGDLRACYETGQFSRPVQIYSARVLNDQNHFDDELLIVTQMRQAVSRFASAPFFCKVFNLSIGTYAPALQETARQTLWAEELDKLAREFGVIFVVASGNNPTVMSTNPRRAEEILRQYPRTLLEPEAQLSDPATAALALTVGGTVRDVTPGVVHGAGRQDIVRAVVETPQLPSPFTRSGPGVQGSIKPEVMGYGGNVAFVGFGGTRRTTKEGGTAIMSASHQPTTSLFAFDVGTSYAAPQVARLAAITWSDLERSLERRVSANLVRAMIAQASDVPTVARDALGILGPHASLQIYGYGVPDEDFVLYSGDKRVTLVAESEITANHFHIYRIPVPSEMRDAPGRKSMTVSLAFDPPVRRRRSEYLGVEMQFLVVRGKSLDEVTDAYRRLRPEEDGESAFRSPYKISFEPSPMPHGSNMRIKKGNLQKGTWTFSRSLASYGSDYWLIVRAHRKWAPTTWIQSYAVAVTLAADDDRLYSVVRERVGLPIRVRV